MLKHRVFPGGSARVFFRPRQKAMSRDGISPARAEPNMRGDFACLPLAQGVSTIALRLTFRVQRTEPRRGEGPLE